MTSRQLLTKTVKTKAYLLKAILEERTSGMGPNTKLALYQTLEAVNNLIDQLTAHV